MAVVELRGPCGHLATVLDTAQGIIQFYCRQCSHRERRRVVHWFSVHDGMPLETLKELHGETTDDDEVVID